MEFKKLIIKGLYGIESRDITIPFVNNKIVIIGENGVGKTTIMNILYTILENKPIFSTYVEFSAAELVYQEDGNKEKSLTIKGITKMPTETEIKELPNGILLFDNFNQEKNNVIDMFSKITNNYSDDFFTSDKFKVLKLKIKNRSWLTTFVSELQQYDSKGQIYVNLINTTQRYMAHFNDLIRLFYTKKLQETEANRHFIKEQFNVMYLSVDRMRPEVSPNFKNSNIYNKNIEIINVTDDIATILTNVKSKITSAYNQANSIILNSAFSIIRSYISDSENSDLDISAEHSRGYSEIIQQVMHLKEDEREKIEQLFFKTQTEPMPKSLKINLNNAIAKPYEESSKKLHKANEFIETVNKILTNKKVEISKTTHNIFFTDLNTNKRFNLINNAHMLSSGERQIFTILFNVILTDKPTILLMDEPELSLSVDWQSQLFEYILNSDNVAMLFAVTHSPFILNESNLDILYDLGDSDGE